MARFKDSGDPPAHAAQDTGYRRADVSRYQAERRRKRRLGVAGRVLIVVAAVLAVGAAALAFWTNDIQRRMNDEQVVDTELRESLAEEKAPSDPYYVLLLGTDGRPGETDYRADTIILARVDPKSKRATLLSIPRDTKVTWKGETMKINGVHTYAGAAGMVQIVSELFDVDIAHYAEVSFDGLSTITDAMGGVVVDVDQYMFDDENFDVVTELQPGVQRLDGEQALFYCRCRHFVDGDYTRMRHQRTFIKAMLSQIMSSYDPVTIVNLVNATADVVTTDLTVSQIVDLATEMQGLDVETGIYTAFVPSVAEEIGGVSYVIADWDATAEMMKVIDAGGDPSSFDEGLFGYQKGDRYGSDEDDADDGATDDDATGANEADATEGTAMTGQGSSTASGSTSR